MKKSCNANLSMIAKRYNISEIFAKVLVNRGLYTWQAMDTYLFPDITAMHQPQKMKDLQKAGDILDEKIKQNEKIMVIGDYDVDGIMSSYILVHGLKILGADVSYRIPHRVKDGYGIRAYMVDEAYEKGISAIITCDNGISAVDAALRAKQYRMTYILTDHHEVPTDENGEVLPCADAIVNPKQMACEYPFPVLCGAGVTYKLIEYLFQKRGDDSYTEEFLPFAAVATVCDVVPLIGENRIIVSNGLKILSDRKRLHNIGMRALIDELQIDRELYSGDLGFKIGPCLNAAGRLEDAVFGLKLMLEEDELTARAMAKSLVELNEKRKAMTEDAVQKAVELADATDIDNEPVLLLYLEDCHESVAGIVAGRIREKYYRPTIILTKSERGLKGSGRSIPKYHMQQALLKCKELLIEFGGHAMAAGLSVSPDNLEPLRKALNEQCSLTKDELIEKVSFDDELDFKSVTKELICQLKYMEPFGEENSGAVFAKTNVTVKSLYMCGRNYNIARLRLEEDGVLYDAVDFNADIHFPQAMEERYTAGTWEDMKAGKCGQTIDILYVPDINDRYGNIQFKIVEVR